MNPWRQFFNQYAPQYDGHVFTKNTTAEVEFIVRHTSTPQGGAILDLGCGTGRHSVPLAQHGYRVTGVDISEGMLALAQQRAQHAGVHVEFVRANADQFARPESFDSVICLCEGAMCLLSGEDDPLRRDMTILRNMCTSLKPGGILILNVLSALRVVRSITDQNMADGRFDPLTMTERSDVLSLLPDLPNSSSLRERYYTAPELRRMAEDVGLRVSGIYGGTAGNWGLRPIELDDYELMLIATR